MRNAKKILAMALILIMLVSFAGCFGPESYEEFYATYSTTPFTTNPVGTTPTTAYYEEPTESTDDFTQGGSEVGNESFGNQGDISYGLIYNPALYNEDASYNKTLSTGSIGSQIDISLSRGDGLTDETPEFIPISQADIDAGMKNVQVDLTGARGDGLQENYSLGDSKQFYVGYPSLGRTLQTLQCVYAGTYCVIWTPAGCLSQADASEFGTEFDNRIYPETTKTFGMPRYSDVGGKVHLIFAPIKKYTLGYFWQYDLYATGELRQSDIETYGCNTDVAVVHVNSDYVSTHRDSICATMAHEFQHLINASDMFYTYRGDYANYVSQSWINEGMSGYIEEVLYPGAMEVNDRYNSFMNSNLIRHGQSMYNFKTNQTDADFDIGVYGSVFLFSQYLENIAGKNVFKDFHDYWRYSRSETIDDAEALYNAISSPDALVSRYRYPSSISFDTAEQEWLSKLILDFYLSMLCYDSSDPAAFAKFDAKALLYDEINATNIEGGGRIIVATYDGTFEIPADADSGLIYIGLNSNFEPITDIIYK